eukprot:386254_1
MCWGNHDQEDHEDVDFVDLEAQTGKQPAPPDLDRVRSGSMSGLKLTTANVAWAVGGLLLLVFALFVVYRIFDAKNSTNNGLEAEYLAWEQTRPADQQLLADQQRLADQRLAGQSGAEEQGALEEQKRLANEQATAASSIIPTGNVASYNNPPIATGAYHEEAKERQRGLTELQRKSDTLKKERVAKKQQEQVEERRKQEALMAEHRREMQKLADEQEEKEREELAATATRQSGFDSIIPTVNFSYRPLAANGFSADKEEVKEIRETEDDDEMEMDKWIKEEEKRENDVVKPRSFGVLSQNSAPQQPKRNHPSGTALPTYMPGPLFPPSNNVVKPRSHGVLSQPQLPQNQLDSGNGSSIQHVIQRTQSHAPLQYSNQSQTQLIQPVAPLSFSNTDWECPQCTTKNEGSEKKCRICSKPNPALTEDPEQKVDSPQQDPNKQSSMKANDEVGDQNARGPNDDANRNFFADFGIKDLQRQQTEGQNRLEAAQKAKAAFEAAPLAPHMQPSGFQPSNNDLNQPPLPQNQPRSGTGLSNQSQTQQTQPVAPLSFSYNAASSIQPVIHQTQPSPLQYSKPMNPNNDWECTKCTATNKGSDKKCMICGTPNPALPEDPEQKVVQQDEKEQSAMVTTPRPKFYSVTWNSRNGGLLSVTLDDETSEHLQNDKSKSLSLELQTESSGGVWKSVCSCPKQGLLLNLQLLKNKKVGKNLRLCMKGPNGDEVFSETKEIPDGALRRLVQHRERKDRKAKQNAHNRFGSFTRS